MPVRTRKLSVAAAAQNRATIEKCCIGGVCDPQRVQGLKAPARKGTYDLINLEGPGLFLGGGVSKQGGLTGLTFVRLQIDGRGVIDISFAAARNLGFTQQNPMGLVLLGTSVLQNLTFGWPAPLVFKRSLKLSVVVNETGVVQIVANVLRGGC